ncbi:MAG: aldehyde reductase [Bacteroidota bacterium]
MSTPVTDAPVLLSGLTGYIGSYIAAGLLNRGYAVRGTMRNAAKFERVRAALAEHAPVEKLTVAEADLLDADAWHRAMEGVTHVQHVASPFFAAQPDDPDEMVVPAREGTLNVLRAATEAGVQRVVLTSSFVAVGYGVTAPPTQPFTEERWTDTTIADDVNPYILSKTIAERAAWDYVRATPGAPELATVNPSLVLGPLMTDNASASHVVLQKMMKGEMPGVPKFGFEIVDVRDVSDLHIRAMEAPEAAGERYLAAAGHRTFKQVAAHIREAAPAYRKKLPKFELPDFGMRLFALFDAEARGALNELGKHRTASNAKARTQLGWAPRSPDDAIAASTRDLIAHGLV